MLEALQRQSTAVTEQHTDAELEALLAQISASLPSTAEVDAWVEQVASTPVPERPTTPAWEAVTATTAGEYSRGELEQYIMRSWRRQRLDFTTAAREAAAQDSARRPRAVQSRRARGARYASRWALSLLAADYERGGSDLPDVAALLRRGSPFQQALRGSFDRVVAPVRNPAGAQIISSIDETVGQLNESLDPGELGQLVVTFSGHGGNGILVGVDGERVTPMQLRDSAEFAALLRVQVVYVLDTCRSGTLVQFAQSEGLADLRESVRHLDDDERAELEGFLTQIADLGHRLFDVGQRVIEVGDAATDYRERRSDENTVALIESLLQLSGSNLELQQFLAGTRLPEGAPDWSPLEAEVEKLGWRTLAAMSLGSRRPANGVLRQSSVVLDGGADLINELLGHLSRSTGARGRSRAPAAASR